MATLTALYVVRNEADFIKKSLDSVSPYVDELVVVDSMSIDRTLYHCRQYRNLSLHQYKWVHDFSKIRNFGIKKCVTDWILVVDADEIIDKRSMQAIRSAVDSASDEVMGLGLHIVDHESEWDTSIETSNPRPFFGSPQVRAFRRSPKIYYEGRIGESVDESISRINGTVNVLDARIHHYLWRGKGQEYAKMKLKYYNSIVKNTFQDPGIPAKTRAVDPEPATKGDPVVAIVMLGHNCLDHTKRAIESVQRNTSVPYKLFFVDNGSTDGTAAFLRDAPGIVPVILPSNAGVSMGKNTGLTQALKTKAKYVCVMDNDVVVAKGWLDEMLEVAKCDNAGVVGPMTSFADGTQLLMGKYPSPDAAASAIAAREPRSSKVENIHGFCMLVPTATFREVGMFDESFGAYGNEDHDFCLRIAQAGKDVLVSNRAYVEHVGRATMRSSMRGLNWHAIMRTSDTRFKSKWQMKPAGNTPSTPASLKGMIPQASSGSTNPKISIVILTHNRLDMTRECLESISRQTCNHELIIVDNNSTDGTLEHVAGRFPSAVVIKNDKNLGVPRARNQGIRASSCDFIVMMDNDVMVRQGWIDELFGAMRSNDADIIGIEGWQLDNNHAACHKCMNENERVDYLGGACCLFKRKVFEKAGLLDEGFSPAYYEDVEICIRARRCGFKLLWHPTTKIKHKEHSTLIHGQKDFSYQEALSRSQQRFAAKMRGELSVEHEKLPADSRKIKILYLGMQWDYGHRDRGHSFEHDNFYPSLRDWDRTKELVHFDFVELGKQHGIQKMSDMLVEAVQVHCPDALFAIFFDPNHDPRREVLGHISRTTPTKTIGWFCDSHWRYGNFDKPWSEHLNFNVTTSTVVREWYVRDGLGNKVIKSQWAFSPKYRQIGGVKRDVGVSFVGQPHGNRRQRIQDAKQSGLDVQCYGTGWARRLNFDEMLMMFNRSKVNLNFTNSCDSKWLQLKGRNFEIPAAGGFLLSERAEDLGSLYIEGKEIECFTSSKEMVEKTKYYIARDEERERIAAAGRERALRDHTYAQRFNHVFKSAGLI